jgi:hypothetical protein
MTKADIVLGPEFLDFNAALVRVEFETGEGAAFFEEIFGPRLQVQMLKSAIPAFIDRLRKRGLTHRVGSESDLFTPAID